VQKPEEPNYDIQLAAASDGRIQSKVRAYAHSGRSPGINMRDLEVEGNWCADLKAPKLSFRHTADHPACN
jgi:hypothetical protein